MALLGRPVVITDAMLTSSTVPETVPGGWNLATTYAAGATVAIAAGGTVWDVYVSIQASNTNRPPASSPTWWRKVTTLYSAVSTTTPYYKDQIVTDTVNHRLYKSLVGTAVTVSVDASSDFITWTNLPLANGAGVVFNDNFSPVVAGTEYYIGDKSGDTFRLYTAPSGGSLVNIAGSSVTNRTIVTSPNLNAPFSDEAKWADAGPTNRRAMFDKSNSTVTSEDNQQLVVVVTMPAGTRFNALALLNLSGVSSATITAQAAGVTRYNRTFDLTDNSFADESYVSIYNPAVYRRNMAVSDIPPYDAMTLTITLSGPGVVSIGNAVPALTNWIGDAERTARSGIRDYSIKEETEWGGVDLTERGYANIGTFTTFPPTRKSDAIKDLLERCRATPMLWLMAEDSAMPGGWAGRGIYYGIWKNFGFAWTDGDEDQLDTELLGFV